MRTTMVAASCIASALLAVGGLDAASAGAGGAGTEATVPVLVELFTAEGCSSCPPADALLEKMRDAQPTKGAEIIALGEHVDYWNQSGWKDRFASAAFTKRQQLYAAHFGKDEVYTPQMVIDGEAAFVGSDVGAARAAIEHAITVPHGRLRLALDAATHDGNDVAVSVEVVDLPAVDRDDPADVIVAMTEDGLRTDVKRGENQGRTLTHAAVVRELRTAGDAIAGRSVRTTFGLGGDWREASLRVVGFVQQRRSRRVLASATMPFAESHP